MPAPGPEPGARQVFRVFLFTDLAGSTDLKRRLGDLAGARAIARSNELFRKALARHGGREQDNAGDGFFAHFDVPSQALLCALEFQREMAGLVDPEPLQARVGIHLGESVQLAEEGAPAEALRGLAVDAAARVMGLALPGQILLTRHAFDSVRQNVRAAPDGAAIEWLAHGPYRFKGLDDPLEVYEVGVRGLSPLRPPPDSEKAHRAVAPGDEETLGWRPAVGLGVPTRPSWRLQRKLGDGGFGEVWLAVHETFREQRVFKFCFEAERVRGLKREVVLFRLLRETLGDRPDVVRVLDWQMEQPPYSIELEHVTGGDLVEWIAEEGGFGEVPLDMRLELAAQVADALGAAHRAGILHRDVKPQNVLVATDANGAPLARLTDFGIGLVTDRAALAARGLPEAGFTETVFGPEGSSGSGTRLYMAPELAAGHPATTCSDVFALGTLLYQLAVGDFRRPVGPGWERDIADEMLREDIAACVDVDPGRRLATAAELAERLRGLGARRAEREATRRHALEAQEALEAAAAASRRREHRRFAAALSLVVISLAAIALCWAELGRASREVDALYAGVIERLGDAMIGKVDAAAHRLVETFPEEPGAEALARGLAELEAWYRTDHASHTGEGLVVVDAADRIVLDTSAAGGTQADAAGRTWDMQAVREGEVGRHAHCQTGELGEGEKLCAFAAFALAASEGWVAVVMLEDDLYARARRIEEGLERVALSSSALGVLIFGIWAGVLVTHWSDRRRGASPAPAQCATSLSTARATAMESAS
jgi:class 3 adenylate cyclase